MPEMFQNVALDVNGMRFDALAQGPADGPLVLFLHGFPEFADAWIPILQPIADAGYRAVAVNQRGYSPGARPHDVAAYATDLLVSDTLGFADALGASRFHLVAHDWGGLLAWQVAADHPDRIASLTVLSTPHPTAFLKAVKSNLDQMRRSAYIALFRAPSHVAEQQLLADEAAKLRAAYQGKLPAAQVEENVQRLSEPYALTAALNWYRVLDLNLRTGTVNVPTAYVWGTEDIALGETAAKNTVDYVTGPYRFEPLEGKSHWLLEEAPDEIASLILQQLRASQLV